MVDLHLHLDGAISLASARKLAQAQGLELPARDEDLLPMLTVPDSCCDLNEFLQKFDFTCSLLQTAEGIRMAVKNLLAELKEEGVMYAEIRFAPQLLTDKGLTQEEAVAAAISGMQESEVDANLILCCMRGAYNHDKNAKTVEVAEKFLGKGVVAIDLAGAEALYETGLFEDVLAMAVKKGIPFTIHAGEASGPDSVRKALDFGAVRIGHGIRAMEDESLFAEIVKKQIPLELCPTSNIKTAMFRHIDEWPLRKLMQAGAYITVNTDDPAIEGTSIKNEFRKLIKFHGIGAAEVKTFLLNSVNASFASEEIKQKMQKKIETELSSPLR
ncbi:MAG: adenosine deaminase [Lachnospiraceae bacterium]|nr:adenosine deaminase [Candidatus Minthocola equi]